MLRELKNGDKVCLLRKALYGLRQADRHWHVKLCQKIRNFGLKQSLADPCVFFTGKGKDILIVAAYVLVASRDPSKIIKFTKYLSSKFQIKDLGELKYCLGIEFSQGENKVTMIQREILNRFGMEDSKPVGLLLR